MPFRHPDADAAAPKRNTLFGALVGGGVVFIVLAFLWFEAVSKPVWLSGVVDDRMADKVRFHLAIGAREFAISSGGGSLRSAYDIGEMFDQHQVTLHIPQWCFAACANVIMPGAHRIVLGEDLGIDLGLGAFVGFHHSLQSFRTFLDTQGLGEASGGEALLVVERAFVDRVSDRIDLERVSGDVIERLGPISATPLADCEPSGDRACYTLETRLPVWIPTDAELRAYGFPIERRGWAGSVSGIADRLECRYDKLGYVCSTLLGFFAIGAAPEAHNP